MRPISLAAALLAACTILSAGTIHLKTGDIRTSGALALWNGRAPRQLTPNRRHLMVEFSAPVSQEMLAALTAQGAVVNSSLGQRVLMISVPDGMDLKRAGAVWASPLPTRDKLSPIISGAATASAWLVKFQSDVTAANAEIILADGGFLRIPNRYLLANEFLVRGNPDALPKLAEWDEVAYIYPASRELVNGGRVLACSGALSQGQVSPQFVKVGNGWAPNGPNFLTLNYVFTKLTPKLPADQVRSEILRAMRQWSAVGNVQFAEGTDPGAPWTIAIEFGTTVNNDPTPFDPSGIILAHTYYPAPPNAEPLAGDLHFDPVEDWHIGATTDIYTVALHELGHALGLAHTDNPQDIMYPYYRFGAPLGPDDIAGVQSLYGVPAGAPTSGTAPIASPAQPPPSIVVTAPAVGATTSNATTAVSGVVLNATGTSVVTWQSSHGASGQAFGTPVWSTGNIVLDPGPNTITLTATDGSQATASSVVQIQFVPATAGSGSTGGSSGGANSNGTAAGVTAPVITILSPQNGAATETASVTIAGTAVDTAGIASVTWETNAGATGTAVGTANWTASGVPLFPGQNTIVVRATNTAGVMRWASLVLLRN